MRAPLMHQMAAALAPETFMVSKAGVFVWPCRTTPSSTQRAQALPSSSPSLVCPLPSPLLHPSHFSLLWPHSFLNPSPCSSSRATATTNSATSPNSNPFSTSYAPRRHPGVPSRDPAAPNHQTAPKSPLAPSPAKRTHPPRHPPRNPRRRPLLQPPTSIQPNPAPRPHPSRLSNRHLDPPTTAGARQPTTHVIRVTTGTQLHPPPSVIPASAAGTQQPRPTHWAGLQAPSSAPGSTPRLRRSALIRRRKHHL